MSFERERQEPHLPALSVDCENLRDLELLLAHLLSQWLPTELLESPAHFQPLSLMKSAKSEVACSA